MTIYERTELKRKVKGLTNATATITGSTIKFVTEIDGIGYWYDTAWVESNYTIAEANTIADIVTQSATLPFSTIKGNDFRLVVIKDYTSPEPTIDLLTLELEEIQDVLVQGTEVEIDLIDLEGEEEEGVVIQAQLTNLSQPAKYRDKFAITNTVIEKTTNKDGKAYFMLYPNSLILPLYTHWTIRIGNLPAKNYDIPLQAKINLSTLTPL